MGLSLLKNQWFQFQWLTNLVATVTVYMVAMFPYITFLGKNKAGLNKLASRLNTPELSGLSSEELKEQYPKMYFKMWHYHALITGGSHLALLLFQHWETHGMVAFARSGSSFVLSPAHHME